jgi:riboflavin kinase/FMN adenylyltransferase
MQVVKGFNHVPAGLKGNALAIGNFDGVHRGHQALLRATLAEARRLGRPAGAMVFEPHPRSFFRPSEPLFALTPLDEKLRLFRALELDFTAVIEFNAEIASMPPATFVSRVLLEGLGTRHVVIGYDFYFGKGRAGRPETMRELGRTLDFGVTVIEPQAEAGEVFSSSAVRARLATGDVRGAANELGHWWRVSGVVTGGAHRGTGMGFPTANIRLSPGTSLGHGIFAVRVGLPEPDGTRRVVQGAAYFGQRPTFDNGAPVLEVFLLDFDGNLYGREIEIDFIAFVRPDQRFPGMEALIVQMEKDCARARELLAEAERENPFGEEPAGRG